ncbi:MAG: hypothetical protein ACRD2M_11180, partial [Terriglobales bacterium]
MMVAVLLAGCAEEGQPTRTSYEEDREKAISIVQQKYIPSEKLLSLRPDLRVPSWYERDLDPEEKLDWFAIRFKEVWLVRVFVRVPEEVTVSGREDLPPAWRYYKTHRITGNWQVNVRNGSAAVDMDPSAVPSMTMEFFVEVAM